MPECAVEAHMLARSGVHDPQPLHGRRVKRVAHREAREDEGWHRDLGSREIRDRRHVGKRIVATGANVKVAV